MCWIECLLMLVSHPKLISPETHNKLSSISTSPSHTLFQTSVCLSPLFLFLILLSKSMPMSASPLCSLCQFNRVLNGSCYHRIEGNRWPQPMWPNFPFTAGIFHAGIYLLKVLLLFFLKPCLNHLKLYDMWHSIFLVWSFNLWSHLAVQCYKELAVVDFS